jgi:hypothetical protein
MNLLKIKASNASPRWFSLLEKRRLIRILTPTARILRSRSGQGAVDVVYSSAPRFGTHKLICVKPDSAVPILNFHPDNEEFILIDARRGGIRPLYMLIGLSKSGVLRAKASRGLLRARDFALLKMPFNGRTCVFTMCRDTVHCEIVFPGKGNAPVFFVTEPGNLPMEFLRLPGYSFSLDEGGTR